LLTFRAILENLRLKSNKLQYNNLGLKRFIITSFFILNEILTFFIKYVFLNKVISLFHVFIKCLKNA